MFRIVAPVLTLFLATGPAMSAPDNRTKKPAPLYSEDPALDAHVSPFMALPPWGELLASARHESASRSVGVGPPFGIGSGRQVSATCPLEQSPQSTCFSITAQLPFRRWCAKTSEETTL
jgi:hypothetical protein